MEFSTKVIAINKVNIILLPNDISQKLPSRGIVMVEGEVNDTSFKAILEPDGKGGHWWKLEDDFLKKSKLKPGDEVEIKISLSNDWIEPEVPVDLKKALSTSPKAEDLWKDITPMARWDWIRWINSTKSPDTRHHRIDVLCSKMEAGKRRVCCFDRTKCTEIFLSRNGVLTFPSI